MSVGSELTGPKKPKGFLIAGLVFLLLSLGGCGFGGVMLASSASDIMDAVQAAQTQPSGSTVELSDASGLVLLFGTRQDMTCDVIDQNGTAVHESTNSPTGYVETSGSETQFFLESFDAKLADVYQVTCSNSEFNGEFSVVNIPGLGSLATSFAGFGVGGFFFLIGGICFIVGLVQRGKWKRNQREAGQFPGSAPYPGAPAPSQTGSPGWVPPSPPGQPVPPAPQGQAPPFGGVVPPPAPGSFDQPTAPTPTPPPPPQQGPPTQTPPPYAG